MINAESIGARLPLFAQLFRIKTIPVEKRKIVPLKMDDIFISEKTTTFTPFGERLYGTLNAQESLLYSRITPERRSETWEDIKKRCRELKIKENRLSEIESQFRLLIKERESKLIILEKANPVKL
jgi:hypothetical protein